MVENERWKQEAMKRLREYGPIGASDAEKERFQAEEMEKLKNWDFTPVKMKNTKKPSFLLKLGTYAAWGMGKLLGTALQILTLGHFWRAKSGTRFATTDRSKWQTVKNYQNIPGWDGAKFDPKDKDVIADFRRVPTVWSRLTADKAADTVQNGDQKEEKPLDPIVSKPYCEFRYVRCFRL